VADIWKPSPTILTHRKTVAVDKSTRSQTVEEACLAVFTSLLLLLLRWSRLSQSIRRRSETAQVGTCIASGECTYLENMEACANGVA
jgi:hypothetical protein